MRNKLAQDDHRATKYRLLIQKYLSGAFHPIQMNRGQPRNQIISIRHVQCLLQHTHKFWNAS